MITIDTDYLAQFRAFTEFAKAQIDVGNEDAVATSHNKTELGAKIDLNTSDAPRAFFSKLFRSSANKQANNATRTLFKETIVKLFGGSEDNIPEDVKTAMHMSRFNQGGRPLTARRISQVSTAVLNQLLAMKDESFTDLTGNEVSVESVRAVLDGKITTPSNSRILDNISQSNVDGLPLNIQNALEGLKNEINNRCGKETVNSAKDVIKFVGRYQIEEALRGKAHGMVRDLNSQDVLDAAKDILNGGVYEMAKMKERLAALENEVEELKGSDVSNYLIDKMFDVIPNLRDQLRRCNTAAAYKAVLDEFEPQIKARMEISAMLNKCDNNSAETLSKTFQKLTGIDPKTLTPGLSTFTFSRKEVEALMSEINSGKKKIETAKDVEKAFQDLTEKYVEDRKKLAEDSVKKFKGLVPDWALDHIRKCALVTPNIDEFRLESADYVKQISIQSLKRAICNKPCDMEDVAKETLNIFRMVDNSGKAAFGVNKWNGFGLDGQQQFAGLMLVGAFSEDVELINELCDHCEEIKKAIEELLTTLPIDNPDRQLWSINEAFVPTIRSLALALPK